MIWPQYTDSRRIIWYRLCHPEYYPSKIITFNALADFSGRSKSLTSFDVRDLYTRPSSATESSEVKSVINEFPYDLDLRHKSTQAIVFLIPWFMTNFHKIFPLNLKKSRDCAMNMFNFIDNDIDFSNNYNFAMLVLCHYFANCILKHKG